MIKIKAFLNGILGKKITLSQLIYANKYYDIGVKLKTKIMR